MKATNAGRANRKPAADDRRAIAEPQVLKVFKHCIARVNASIAQLCATLCRFCPVWLEICGSRTISPQIAQFSSSRGRTGRNHQG
jgi:hypothetical protein